MRAYVFLLFKGFNSRGVFSLVPFFYPNSSIASTNALGITRKGYQEGWVATVFSLTDIKCRGGLEVAKGKTYIN